jgi:hypothetical protein
MYKVEYAMGDAFNYKSMEFHNLLSACDVEYSGDEFDSDFEVSKEEWRKAIDKLKDLHDLDDDKREEITGAIEDLASTIDEVIHMMEYYLEHGDPDIDYLHLSYF